MSRIHLSFATRDLEEGIAFYTTLLGVGPDKVREGYARFAPAHVPIVLSLHQSDHDALDHLGVRVDGPDEVSAALERAKAAGLSHRIEERTTCCYAVQDKVWLSDPAGNAWEVYRVTDDAAPRLRDDDSVCCVPRAASDSVGA